ncbi:MAG: kinetochore-associated Ndc80 complex subunit spc25 [Chaenotheca gracillima]|nr:MAG: kinetochore-associated Ndc80 complex subunit spc25 [Chaenotheca gracillima]
MTQPGGPQANGGADVDTTNPPHSTFENQSTPKTNTNVTNMASHCHDEHSGHDHHGHDHSGGGGHDHSDDVTPALQKYLYQQIDFDKITTLNEVAPDSGTAIVKKGWEKRLDPQPELESDADEQLLMYIPFAGQVKLHNIMIRSSPSSCAPLTLKLFINRDDLDFSSASDLSPTQTLELSQTSDIQEMPLKRVLWNTTRSVTLFFEDNHSRGEEDVTRLSFLGFQGEFMKLSREPVNFLYEAAANPSDHKPIVGASNMMSGGIGGGKHGDGM